jgi:hypothetical protein
MKASTIAIIICCCLSVGYGIYLKSYDTFARIKQAKEGMTRQQVTAALSTPDSTYWEKSKNDSLLVLAYELEGTEGNTILVKLRNDTVRTVKFQQSGKRASPTK